MLRVPFSVRVPRGRWRPRSLFEIAVAAAFLTAGGQAARAADMSGHWKGEWHSTTEIFHGIVNARITRCDARHYKCVFNGWAFKIMPFRYTQILTACTDPETGCIHFKATRHIPIWGMYWMNGWASNCKFCAKYHTDENRGYFVMHRVCD